MRSLGGASCLGGTYVHVICFVDKKVIEHAHSLNDRVPSPTDLHNARHSDYGFFTYQSQRPYSDRDSDRYTDCWFLPYNSH